MICVGLSRLRAWSGCPLSAHKIVLILLKKNGENLHRSSHHSITLIINLSISHKSLKFNSKITLNKKTINSSFQKKTFKHNIASSSISLFWGKKIATFSCFVIWNLISLLCSFCAFQFFSTDLLSFLLFFKIWWDYSIKTTIFSLWSVKRLNRSLGGTGPLKTVFWWQGRTCEGKILHMNPIYRHSH